MNHFRILALNLALPLLLTPIASAQLFEVDVPGGAYEAPVWEDAQGELYSETFIIVFSENVIDVSKGIDFVTRSHIETQYEDIADAFELIDTIYRLDYIQKVHPHITWGDTQFTNIRTGYTVTIPDLSQRFTIRLAEPASIDTVVNLFDGADGVESISGPEIIYLLGDNAPNDWIYTNLGQWELDLMQAEKAWGFSRGLLPFRSVGIAITDLFNCDFIVEHQDLVDKIIYVDFCSSTPSPHGIAVSGFAAAHTNNGTGVASLGWHAEILAFRLGRLGLEQVVNAVTDDTHPAHGLIDVVQNSWIAPGATTENYVRSLLTLGVIVTGSTGNSDACVGALCAPFYPSSHYFDDLDDGQGGTFVGQVISATSSTPQDTFVPGFTYSLGDDPINDPVNSFIDVAAAGCECYWLYCQYVDPNQTIQCGVGNPVNACGTSYAGPIVAGLVALLLSINPDLRVDKYYEVITRSTDKIDQSAHPDTLFWTDDTREDLSWNTHTGYGRINAHKAVVYMLERFGGSAGGQGFVMDFAQPSFMGHGFANVTFAGPASVTFDGGTTVKTLTDMSLNVVGDIFADGVTFTVRKVHTQADGWKGITFLQGSTGTILNSSLESVRGGASVAGIRSIGASVLIQGSEILVAAGATGPEHAYASGVQSSGTGVHDGVEIVRSTIESLSGPAIFAHAYGSVYVHESGLRIDTPLNSPLIRADGAQASVRFSVLPTVELGLNEQHGGRLLSRGNTALINAGIDDVSYSYNHFCDADAAVLEVDDGGTIYAQYNYWPAGGPTAITGTGTVYYSNNLGLASCNRAASSAMDVRASHVPSVGDAGDAALLFQALSFIADGNIAEARQLLRALVVGGGAHARTALMELGRLLLATPHAETRGFLQQLASGTGSLRVPALQVLAELAINDGEYQLARSYLGMIAALRPDSGNALFAMITMVHVHLSEGELEHALTVLSTLSPRNEDDARTIEALAGVVESYIEWFGEGDGRHVGDSGIGPVSLTYDDRDAGFVISVYPNPASRVAFIDLSLSGEAFLEVAVFDVLGRHVGGQRIATTSETGSTIPLDVSHLGSGVYFVRVKLDDDTTAPRIETRQITVVR